MKPKQYFCVFVKDMGYVVQQPKCLEFSNSLDDATLFSAKWRAEAAISDYDFGTEAVISPITVLGPLLTSALTFNTDQSADSRLSLALHTGDERREVFSTNLSSNIPEAVAKANSASMWLSLLFGDLNGH